MKTVLADRMIVPMVLGLVAALGLVGFYMGIVAAAQGWGHALGLLAEDRPFVAALAAGFGAQTGLFSYLHAPDCR